MELIEESNITLPRQVTSMKCTTQKLVSEVGPVVAKHAQHDQRDRTLDDHIGLQVGAFIKM
jgi:hypothetical protein